jgi:hypothetical protein
MDWADEAFGVAVDELRERIPAALALAHLRARAGHDAAHSESNRVYGTALWELQHEELVAALRSVPGAKVARFGAYELMIVAGKALFPLRYTDVAGRSVETARLEKPVSGLRQRLFGAHAPEVREPHPYLDESWAELDPPAGYEPFPQLGDDTELIVIAYACNLEAGVLNIEWGRAEHVGDGELHWGDHSRLPLLSAGRGLTVTGHAGDRRFDTGSQPMLSVDMRTSGERPEPNHLRAQDA